jgi:hypothetical protein
VFVARVQFPANFESMTADQKLAYFEKRIAADNGIAGTWYGGLDATKLILPEVMGGQDLYKTGNVHSDAFPEGRKKLIHTVAMAASFEMQMEKDSPYTGCFAHSAKPCSGVTRFSSATTPKPTANAPGISFKLFRDGIESASWMAMWALTGQKQENFFKHPVSNHIDDLPSGFSLDPSVLPVKALVKRFKGYEADPGKVGTYHVAKYTREGKEVPNFKTPFQLVYQPNPALTKLCSKGQGFTPAGNFACMSEIAVGTVLYKIWALAGPTMTPTKKDMKMIGKMVSKSKFVASKFMDHDVEFRHVFWTEELKNVNKPSWESEPKKAGYGLVAGAPKFEKILATTPW